MNCNMTKESELIASNKKIILLVIVSMMFLTSAAAHHYDFPDAQEVVYGESTEIVIECDYDQGACRDAYSNTYALEICGEEADRIRGTFGPTNPTGSYEFDVTIPSDASCGLGESSQLTFNPDDSSMHLDSGGSIDVVANSMEDHIGENMILNKRIDHVGQDTPELRNFQITNDVWDYNTGIATDDAAVIMVQNYDAGGGLPGDGSNLFAVYEVEPTDNPEDNVLSYNDNNVWEWIERVDYTEQRNDEVQIYSASNVLEEDFTSGNLFEYGDVEGSSSWQISSQSPLHDSGNFLLDGEVALGYYPYHYDEDGDLVDPEEGRRDSPDLYVCREGAEMDNGFGDSVSQIVDVTEDEDDFNPLRCNQNTGTWADVGECAVSIDTYGYGYLNNEINGCEENGGDCEAGEAYYDEEDNMFYACYDDGSGNTVEEPYSEWGTSTQDWTESNSDTVIDYGPRTDLFPFEFDCDANDECSRADNHDEDDWRESWRDHGTMNYVEYVAWPSYLQHEQDTIGEPFDSKFVTDTGGWTSRTQALNDAEQLYGPGDEYDEPSLWESLNMTNTGDDSASTIYYGDDAEEYSEAWTVANAGSDEDPISSDSPNFQGGWAGICGEDQWRYMGDEEFEDIDWMCDGEIYPPESSSSGGTTFDTVIIPGFENTAFLPDTEINNDEREIGVVLFPFLNMDSSERQSQLSSDLTDEIVDPYYTQLSDEDGEVESATVNCWAGRLDDKPETATGEFDHNSERAFSGEASMPSGNQLWSVSDTVDTGGYSGYACEWWYDVTDFSEKARGEEGDVAHVHRDGNLQDMIESEYSSFQEEGFP